MYILASTSPRRKEILDKCNLEYKIVTKEIEEIFPSVGSIYDKIMKVALDKGLAVFEDHKEDIVICADTAVIIDNELLGKPIDNNHALEMLLKLNNKRHSVVTGVGIISKDKVISFYEESFVYFKNNSIEEINKYINTKEPCGKAGAYAIQGLGGGLVDHYEGDLDNIIGFPLNKFLDQLNKL